MNQDRLNALVKKWNTKWYPIYKRELDNYEYLNGPYLTSLKLPKERKNMRKKDMIKMIKQLDEKVYKMDNVINRLDKRVDNLNSNITKQLQCGVKGHEFVFDKKELNHWRIYYCFDNKNKSYDENYEYYFKCSKCELTITKTEAELTVKEKNALKILGVLK